MPHQGSATPTAPVQAPTTRMELNILIARRAELNDQLQSLSTRHAQLVDQRHSALVNQNQAVVTELDGRIREFSERITRIEREKLAADDAISAALARAVGESDGELVILPPPPESPVISVPGDGPATGYGPLFVGLDDRAFIVGLLGVVLLGAAAWRWAWRAAERKRARSLPGESDGTRDLRVAVESIALEVERISENQRFITKLLAGRAELDPAMIERGRSGQEPRSE